LWHQDLEGLSGKKLVALAANMRQCRMERAPKGVVRDLIVKSIDGGFISSEAPPQTDEACGLGRLLTVKRTPTAAPAAARSRLHGRPEAMVAVNWPVRSPSTGVRP
jgi:hypothetical protein